jgi:phage-related protein (TIGR01555 family)
MTGFLARMMDGLSSVLAAMGGPNSLEARARAGGSGSQAAYETVYRTSWLARKVHDLPPKDMTREWRSWQAEKNAIEAIEAEERRLQLKQKVRSALLLARLHGGGALVLGLPGNPDQPASLDSIGKGQLGFVHVVNRYQLRIPELVQDPGDPQFGCPVRYEMNVPQSPTVNLHPSRVIPFIDNPIPVGAAGSTVESFWGDPLLESIGTTILDNGRVQETIADLLLEAKVDVITIPDLMTLVGNAEYEQRLIKRLALAHGFKRSNNALLLSGASGPNQQGEEWEQRQLRFDGLTDIAMLFLSVAAGAADIPATRLLGKSPDGMNATGDSDLRNYYDKLASDQVDDLEPRLDPLDEMLIRSALGNRPTDIYYEWNPLWQMQPETAATVGKTKAETVQIWSNLNLIPTIALEKSVQNMLIEDGSLPGLESALEELPDDERYPSESTDVGDPLAMPPNGDPTKVGGNDPNNPAAPPPTRRAANDMRVIRLLRDRGDVSDALAVQLADATPRTLYVSRKVLNAAEIIGHFKSQGIESTVPPESVHVTVASSRTAIDWMKIANEWTSEANGGLVIKPGGPRLVEVLGDRGAIVLLFAANELVWRHQDILRAGASWEFEEYQPHITIVYDAQPDVDLSQVEPWKGEIRLGPEDFQEFKEAWRP